MCHCFDQIKSKTLICIISFLLYLSNRTPVLSSSGASIGARLSRAICHQYSNYVENNVLSSPLVRPPFPDNEQDFCTFYKRNGDIYETMDEDNCIAEQEAGMYGPYLQGEILPVYDRAGNSNYKTKLWKRGILIYRFKDKRDFSEQEIVNITNGMKSITEEIGGCIKFRKRKLTDNDYIEITNHKGGCNAHVGCIGGKQNVNLNKTSCWTQHVIKREFIHAVGFHHEQVRKDRDGYVKIHQENYDRTNKSFATNFGRIPNSVDFGSAYDYDSIMHYSQNAFAKKVNGTKLITIEPLKLKPNQTIGFKTWLSKQNIKQIKAMYKCK